MSFLKNLLDSANKTITSYSGDKAFLNGVASAAANVTAADGKIEDNEIEAAISGMQANAIVDMRLRTLTGLERGLVAQPGGPPGRFLLLLCLPGAARIRPGSDPSHGGRVRPRMEGDLAASRLVRGAGALSSR